MAGGATTDGERCPYGLCDGGGFVVDEETRRGLGILSAHIGDRHGELAIDADSVDDGSDESEQDAYEGEDDACIEAIVKPVSREISQHDRHRESDAELRRHGQRFERCDSSCAVSHPFPRRDTLSLAEGVQAALMAVSSAVMR